MVKSFAQSFSFVGLVFAALLFAASATPSLLPRPYFVQGLLSGFALAVGYAVGVAVVWLWKFLGFQDFSGKTQRNTKWISGIGVAFVSVWFLWRMAYWQNSIRERMELPDIESAYPLTVSLIAIIWAIVLLLIVRGLIAAGRFASRQLGKWMPRRVANFVGFVTIGLLALLLFNDLVVKSLLNAADKAFAAIDSVTDDEIAALEDARATGSDASLVAWETIGRQGKLFIVDGPTRDEIAEFTGESAKPPLRVYVGLRSQPTSAERASLALDELKRVGAFDRSVLVVATPTGTGWLDPGAVDTIEFIHGGDTAIVCMQYSYLPSWISILIDPNRSVDAAHTLFDEVYSYWTTLPKDQRPELYLHGLSLGAMGSETSADLYTIFDDPIQGAVWSGAPFPSRQWKKIVRNRNEGSPAWLPKFRDGSMVRFMNQQSDFPPDQRWGAIRTVYIQYASDPMVWFSPNLAFASPEWLEAPRGSDVSPALEWRPIVTFLQVGFDLPMATSVPTGYGHNYAPASYIDAWVAVTAPEGWNASDTERLKEVFAKRKSSGPSISPN